MLLCVENLTTCLPGTQGPMTVVEDVSFALSQGETLCLVGASGSGKSMTALSIMQLLPAGATHPQGRIALQADHGGQHPVSMDVLRLSRERQRALRGQAMGMIFQDPMSALNPVLRIGEQLLEVVTIHRPHLSLTQARRLVVQALERVELARAPERVDDYPHRLSGGERQRVMIAMALICQTQLLIADEPTSALDAIAQAQILGLLKALQAELGIGILLITHDLGVVAQMADRMAVMAQGRIVESGQVQQLINTPQHACTRALVAALPENLKNLRRSVSIGSEPNQHVAEGGAPLLQVRDLRVCFSQNRGFLRAAQTPLVAVDNVNLSLSAGRVLALVGESGCGKTTLGRAVVRLIKPTSGAVYFNGQEITQMSARGLRVVRRDMQFIFQDPMASLNPRLSIGAMLTEVMAAHGIGESFDARLHLSESLLQSVQLNADSVWRYPQAFSGGQRQRIAIARALAVKPRFIVCDEITSALDTSTQAEILYLLSQLCEARGLSLLLITHDLSVVQAMSDETAVMHQGRIIEYGDTAQICNDPQHPHTRALLAATPRLVY